MTQAAHSIQVGPSAERQQYWRVDELAKLMHVSRDTVTRLFQDEKDVLRIQRAKLGRGGRPYTTLLIPDGVLQRKLRELAR